MTDITYDYICDWTWFRNGHPQNTLSPEPYYPVTWCHNPEYHLIFPETLQSMALGRTTNGVKFTDL
jgi:hypothetical protein